MACQAPGCTGRRPERHTGKGRNIVHAEDPGMGQGGAPIGRQARLLSQGESKYFFTSSFV